MVTTYYQFKKGKTKFMSEALFTLLMLKIESNHEFQECIITNFYINKY